ncbi:hypothetical protein K7432_013054 [Basidiobolus ranarum]|uniref:Uncharacterized protein n=1 Tax=Basidiobolus ranarum TaxID=34480 RepID=A0ABR2VSA0_9FUNG
MAFHNPLNTDALFEDCVPLMITAIAIPIAASNMYQSLKVAYTNNSTSHKISFVAGMILALFTLISVVEVFSQKVGCDRLFGTFQTTWYLSSFLIDLVIYIRVYRSGLLSKIIAVLTLVCQAGRAYFLVRIIMEAQSSLNQLDLCRSVVTKMNSVGTVGTEALCTLLLFVMVVKEIHHRRTKENLDWLTTMVEDGIIYSVGVAIVQIVLTVVTFWGRWPQEFSVFQYISWLITSKLLIEQLEIYQNNRSNNKSLAVADKPTSSLHHTSSGNGLSLNEQASSLQRRSSDKNRLVHPNLTAPWIDTYDKDSPITEITLHTHTTSFP